MGSGGMDTRLRGYDIQEGMDTRVRGYDMGWRVWPFLVTLELIGVQPSVPPDLIGGPWFAQVHLPGVVVREKLTWMSLATTSNLAHMPSPML